MSNFYKSILLAATLAISFNASAWQEYENAYVGSSETYHYVQCNDGVKWEIAVRHSDGAARVKGGTPGYNYTGLTAAAKAVCHE